MATNFAEAIMANAIARMDPALQDQRQAIQGYVAEQQARLTEVKAQSAANIAALLTKAQADNADAVVIETFQRLLAQLGKE